jgi:tripartite-type tricarboxylate transporter receptor subunit TctC
MTGDWRRTLLAAAVCLAAASSARADPVEDFFRGKVISFYIGTGESNGALTGYPQALSEVMPKYIPGHPSIILRNMPGAGGYKAATFIQTVGPQDGTAVGFVTRGVMRAPLLRNPGADFDPRKFQWIGSPSREPTVATIWSEATKVRTLQDAMKEEVVYGATSLGTDTGLFPMVMNQLIGTKFKVVPGYKSSTEVDLAMQRGEAQGKIWTLGSLRSERSLGWWKTGKVVVIAQIGLDKVSDVDAPLALDFARTPDDRQVMELIFSPISLGYPSFVGPGVPKDRVEALRAAFEKTMRDPQFIALLDKNKLALDPLRHDDLSRLIDKLYAMPESVVQRARSLVPPS